MNFAEAQAYCGNVGEAYERVGDAQLAILKAAGCLPGHRLLEIGFGAMCGGRKFVEYLDPGKYVGIEKDWDLFRAWAREDRVNRRALDEKGAVVLPIDNFDPLSFYPMNVPVPTGFNFVFGHSVLSHAAHWQFPQMLTALRPVLAEGAQVIMSIRLREESSYDREWQYPGNSWFAWESVCRFATACGFEVVLHEDWQAIMVAAAPNNCHDWIAFRKVDA